MKHVFISYVREDTPKVEKLVSELKSRGIKVWLDRNDIPVGTRWSDAIRKAIQNGSFFLACFSNQYHKREKTYMNEELTLAIEELRLRPTDRAWFLPLLLDDCEIPDRKIGTGETLADIQYVKLYPEWTVGLERVVLAICGEKDEFNFYRGDLFVDSFMLGYSFVHVILSVGSPYKQDMLNAMKDISENLNIDITDVLEKFDINDYKSSLNRQLEEGSGGLIYQKIADKYDKRVAAVFRLGLFLAGEIYNAKNRKSNLPIYVKRLISQIGLDEKYISKVYREYSGSTEEDNEMFINIILSELSDLG